MNSEPSKEEERQDPEPQSEIDSPIDPNRWSTAVRSWVSEFQQHRSDAALPVNVRNNPDLISPKPPAFQLYQLGISAPAPRRAVSTELPRFAVKPSSMVRRSALRAMFRPPSPNRVGTCTRLRRSASMIFKRNVRPTNVTARRRGHISPVASITMAAFATLLDVVNHDNDLTD